MRSLAPVALALLGAGGCYNDHPTPPVADGGKRGDLAVALSFGDLAMRPHDMVVARDFTFVDTPEDMAQGGPCHPMVNEIMTGTVQSASEEFVELYNPCGDIDVTGWSLGYHSANNGAGPALATFQGTFTAGSYFVVCGTSLWKSMPVWCDGALIGGLAAAGGGVALLDGAKAVVDSVAYEALNVANTYTEGAAAPNPPTMNSPGISIARRPNATDTDNNSADFSVANRITPHAANQ